MYRKEIWSVQTILHVWSKAKIILGQNPLTYRKDNCGAIIRFNDHGNRESKFGWEIDHIIPKSQYGSDLLFNLQPLQWENNAAKGDSTILRCAVRS